MSKRLILCKIPSNHPFRIIFRLFCLCILTSQQLHAHTINYALQDAPVHQVAWFYFKLGFTHIVPQGIDHVLFITGICLINTKLKSIIYQASAFTIAHTVALALSMKNIIVASSPIIEPIIAMSIVFVAIENILLSELKPWRIVLVFLFGLIHGMDFVSSLNEIGLPPDKFFTSIVTFNAGVEVCQVMIIALISSYWTVEKIIG